jgi:hypothetical protein
MKTIILICLLVSIGGAVASGCPEALPARFKSEVPVIKKAALRNSCIGDDFLLLLAIRIQENGGRGKEFGIKAAAAWGTDLETQAAWAAATIMKNHKRYPSLKGESFIHALGGRYCPRKDDPQGNLNWVKNVTYWYKKLKRS